MCYFLHATLLFATLVTVPLWAAEEHSKAQKVVHRATIRLTDGTEVEGRLPKPQAVLVTTSFGLATIDLAQLQQIEVADGEKEHNATLSFASGDKLTARLEMPSFVVESPKGRLRIEYAQLKSLTIAQRLTPAMEPLKIVGVRASGAYQNMRPENAIDNKNGTFWNSGGWKGWLEVDLGKEVPLAEIRYTVQFAPAGKGTVQIYASNEPMGGDRSHATLVKTIAGHMKNGAEFCVNCPPKVTARYVQINCPTARSWFCLREVIVRASQ